MERSPNIGAFRAASLMDTVPAAIANVAKSVVVIAAGACTMASLFFYKLNIVF